MFEVIVGAFVRAVLAGIAVGALLAGIVAVATRFIPLRAATRHMLWMTALIAIAVMPFAGIAVSLARIQPAAVSVVAPNSLSAPLTEKALRDFVFPHNSVDASTNTVPPHAQLPAARPQSADALRWLPALSRAVAVALIAIWAVGAIAGLVGLLISVVRVRGLKRRSLPLSVELSDELPWLVDVTRGREMYLRLSNEIETPVAVGFRRPVILIPADLATADGLAAIESLVIHEHAHIARRDDWTNLIQRVIERIFWFNPLVWILGRRIALEREIASDDAVVDRTGEPQAYATSLWKLAREMRMPEHAVVAPGALFTRKQISIRIERLLASDRARLHGSPAAALAVVLAAGVGIACIATSAPAVELPAAPPVVAHTAPVLPVAPRSAAHLPIAAPHVTYVRAPQPATHAASQAPVRRVSASGITLIRQSAQAHTLKLQAKNIDVQMRPAIPVPAHATAPTIIAAVSPPSPPAEDDNSGPSRQRLTRELVATCMACSLRNADLHGLDLHGLAFDGADLRNADLRDANLADASFHGAEMNGADLRGARLDGVHMSGVSLQRIGLDAGGLRALLPLCMGCDLRGLNLRGIDLHGITLTGADMAGVDLRGANLSGVKFSGVDLSHAKLDGADLTNATLTGSDLSHASLNDMKTTGLHLIGTDIAI